MFLKSQKTRLQLLVIIFVKNNKSYAHSLRHACVTLAKVSFFRDPSQEMSSSSLPPKNRPLIHRSIGQPIRGLHYEVRRRYCSAFYS